MRKKGNGTPFTVEDITYDAFGNATQKTVTVPGGAQRTVSMGYEATGRFMTSSTDAEGMISSSTYDGATGNALSKTNSYGLIESYAYDVWGRPLTITDYLNVSTYRSYEKDINNIVVTEGDDEGRSTITITNALGQVIENKTKTVLGTLVGKAMQYDVYGRQTGESQPGQSGSYNQWNTTSYDEYGRVNQTINFTGKTTSFS